MHSLPAFLQIILDAVKYCSKQFGGDVFVYREVLLYQLTGNEELLLNKEINIIISHDSDFDIHQFYQLLIHHIVINKEIENSDTYCHVISKGFELKINIVHQFDPTILDQAKQFGRFNIDTIFYDLSNDMLRYPSENSEDISVLININNSDNWEFEDILGFARKIGTFKDIKIDENQKKKLENISLATIQESLNTNWEEELEDILITKYAGKALQFMTNTFVDGMPWTFKTLVDYMISLNVPINEESTIETVFNEEKFNLVNSYNDYFLADKKTFETSDEVHHRLTTTLKLLFDSPDLTISKLNVRRIRTMAGEVLGRCCLGSDVSGTIKFFGCGNNVEEIDCLGLPALCPTDSEDCLKNHEAFAHIEENSWLFFGAKLSREWCPGQVCPDADNIHCLQQ